MAAKKKKVVFYINGNSEVSLEPLVSDNAEACFEVDHDVFKKLGVNLNMKNLGTSDDEFISAKVTITVESIEYGAASAAWKPLKEKK